MCCLQTRIVELTNLCTIPALQLNSTILDPAVAREFTRLREEVHELRLSLALLTSHWLSLALIVTVYDELL